MPEALPLQDPAAETRAAPAWRRFVATFAAVFVGGLALVCAAVILTDPYDAGYFPSLIGPGAIDNNEYTNHASRARDPQFDAAIFGNSRGQLLNPAELSRATGFAFVQLYGRGTGPHEQMLMMRFFLHHHPDARAIVVAADNSWCTHDPALPPLVDIPFPDWLYSNSRIVYLAHVFNTRMIDRMSLRIKMALGRLPRRNPDGFSDYEAGRVWDFKPVIPANAGAVAATPPAADPDTFFPGIDRWDRLVATLPADTGVVIAMPPVFYTGVPAAGSRDAAGLAACKDRLARSIAGRTRSAFVDFFVDSPITRDPHNFMDGGHMRNNVAHLMDARIAAALTAPARPAAAR